MSLRITRTRIQKSASFPKQNQKTVNAQQFFSGGRTLNILISAEELMKYWDIRGTSSRLNNSYFYSTVSVENVITTKPHGNSKSGKAFTRTKPGVLENIEGKVKGSAPPSQVYDEVFEEAGGLLNVCSLSDVPRNRKQVENAKYRGKETRSQDELYDLTLKSKVEEEAGKVYIRRLQVAPSPACVLVSDGQVQDVKRFCANTTNTFSVLSIDTTFNIGDYVTPTTYRHLLLEDWRTGKPPSFAWTNTNTHEKEQRHIQPFWSHNQHWTWQRHEKHTICQGQTVQTQYRREWVLIFHSNMASM